MTRTTITPVRTTVLRPTDQRNVDEALHAATPITLPDGRTLSRREILGGLGATAAALTLPSLSASRASAASPSAAVAVAARRPGQGVLVLVTAYGGNDGLNTIVPTQDATYTSVRGQAGIAADKTLRIDDRFGFHPSLAGIKALFRCGKGRHRRRGRLPVTEPQPLPIDGHLAVRRGGSR